MIFDIKYKKTPSSRIGIISHKKYIEDLKNMTYLFVNYNPFFEQNKYYYCRPYRLVHTTNFYKLRSIAKRYLQFMKNNSVVFISYQNETSIFTTLFLVGPLISKKEITSYKSYLTYDDKQVTLYQNNDIALRVKNLFDYTIDEYNQYKEKFLEQIKLKNETLYKDIFVPTEVMDLSKFMLLI